MQITDNEFKKISLMVYERFGINLTEAKRGLVQGRLQKVLRQQGMEDFSQYIDFLEQDQSGEAISELINRISTNHTFFFREKEHFEFMTKSALPEIVETLKKLGQNDLRIWCAGCATGEEPYTMTMQLLDFFGANYSKWHAGLLATDISAKALATAQRGIYPMERLKEVPPNLKSKFFTKTASGEYQVSTQLKNEITFRRFNLMNEKFPFKRPFHIIFCRNVMIYFDQKTRQDLVQRFHDVMEPGGYLFIGHSETLGRDNNIFKYIKPALYRKI